MTTASLPELLLVQDTVDSESVWFEGILNSRIPCRLTVRRGRAEALEYLLDESTPLPAVIVLDHRLPRAHGLEMLEQLRSYERTRHIPVVLFGGQCCEDQPTASAMDCASV